MGLFDGTLGLDVPAPVPAVEPEPTVYAAGGVLGAIGQGVADFQARVRARRIVLALLALGVLVSTGALRLPRP